MINLVIFFNNLQPLTLELNIESISLGKIKLPIGGYDEKTYLDRLRIFVPLHCRIGRRSR